MAYLYFLRHGGTPILLTLSMTALTLPVWSDTVSEGRAIAASGANGAAACAACHGAKGEGRAAAGFPYLAGQGAAYLGRTGETEKIVR